MIVPDWIACVENGPQPAAHVDVMLVNMMLGATDAPNDPVPDTAVPIAGRVIVSSGPPDTTCATPPL